MSFDQPAMARICLLCGKTGSGKTTFARKLEEQGAVRFSTDEWMLGFYGDHMSRELFDHRLQICVETFLDLAEMLVKRSVDVVIDHGFWRRAARDRVRQRLKQTGARIELIYFEVPDAI